jgi:hypothetical protein
MRTKLRDKMQLQLEGPRTVRSLLNYYSYGSSLQISSYCSDLIMIAVIVLVDQRFPELNDYEVEVMVG